MRRHFLLEIRGIVFDLDYQRSGRERLTIHPESFVTAVNADVLTEEIG